MKQQKPKTAGLHWRATLLVLATLLLAPSTSMAITWNDGTFVYNTTYTQGSSGSHTLGANEVAISLYLGKTMEHAKDTIYYTSGWPVSSMADAKEIGKTYTKGDVTYTFLGAINASGFVKDGQMGTGMTGAKYFSREYTLTYSDLEEAVVPATVEHDGVTYKVVAIQKWGFCYPKTTCNFYDICKNVASAYSSNGDTEAAKNNVTSRDYSNINDHSNDYLRTVTFEEPSNIRYIGDYAFMSCNALESVVIPNTVEDLGQGIFECDKKLSEVLFQTVTDPDDTKYGQVKFTKIRNWTFWYCTGLKSLELPDGITEIEGETTGAALQYMTSLINIRLPNTLKTIGPHFLCCAQSLRTLIIPASVTNIKAACFHGCESLEAVYLLGPAASMEAGSNSATNFNGNNVLCLDGVSDCTFFTTDDYISSYRNNSEWGKVAEGSSYYKGHGNKLTTIEPETRTFAGNKWVTAIFPNGVENFRNEVADGGFGPQARVALLDHVNVDDENSNVYHMTFVLIDGNDIPAATPVLICPSEDAVHTMYTNADAASSEFKSEMSKEHAVQVTAENGAVISMKGKYVDYRLMPWDFYYSGGKFYRISTAENAVDIKQCRAYWTLDINGVKAPIGAVEAAMRNQTTGIDEPLNKAAYYVVDGIYDLNGRKLDVAAEELPHGVFIVNGKKIMIK